MQRRWSSANPAASLQESCGFQSLSGNFLRRVCTCYVCLCGYFPACFVCQTTGDYNQMENNSFYLLDKLDRCPGWKPTHIQSQVVEATVPVNPVSKCMGGGMDGFCHYFKMVKAIYLDTDLVASSLHLDHLRLLRSTLKILRRHRSSDDNKAPLDYLFADCISMQLFPSPWFLGCSGMAISCVPVLHPKRVTC